MRLESDQITELLVARSADQLPHPGGTLYEHLVRVAALLAEWGASEDLQTAGLCHASYGTAGYDHALLSLDERSLLRALVGAKAESLVYLYCSCDRRAVYPALRESGRVPFRDRFTGRVHVPSEQDVRAFVELTAANELDLQRHKSAAADEDGATLRRLFADARPWLTDAAWQAWRQLLPGTNPCGLPEQPEPMSPVSISGLDHLVLTVTDPELTSRFYQRVLGMRPITFGDGRLAVGFGTSKFNLHQAGHEITPHAARPVPGSADLCLVTATPPDQIVAHLKAQDVPVEEGPVPRTGAQGPITSIYFRDPDRNLIEVASYAEGSAAGQAD